MPLRWSDQERRALVTGAGAFALAWFAKRVGYSHAYPGAPTRSRKAIYAQARRLWGRGGMTRGVWSMRQLARESGYDVGALWRAASALNHSYKRLTPGGPWLISYDQRADLFAWLAHDFWCKSLRLYNCAWCHETARPHKGAGLCSRCYYAYRRLVRQAPQDALAPPASQIWQRRVARGVAPPRAVLDACARGKT